MRLYEGEKWRGGEGEKGRKIQDTRYKI